MSTIPTPEYTPPSTCPAPTALGTVTYTVDTVAPFAIYAWNPSAPNANGDPFWFQPHDLEGNPWTDHATALAFAQSWINEHFPAQNNITVTGNAVGSVTPPASE